MRKPNRALRVLGAAGLIIGLLAAMIAPVSAQGFEPGPGEDHNPVAPDSRHLESAIYFPWVANDDSTLGLGPADTMISIQNLEDRDAEITISVGGSGGLITYLSRYASKTFTAEELGIGSGSGAPVRVTAVNSQHGFPARGYQGSEQLFPIYWDELDTSPWGCFILRPEQANLLPPRPGFAPPGYQERISELPLEVPRSFIATVDIPYHEWQRWVLDGNTWVLEDFEAGPYPAGALVHLDGQLIVDEDDEEDQDAGGVTYDLDVWLQIQTIWEMLNGGDDGEINPFGGLGVGGNCNAWVEGGVVHSPVAIGGVAKMMAHGETDAAVSGYNALNGWEVFRFDEWYLPIVQTNCGPGGCWDSTIRVAALGGSLNSVTVRFFPADDGSGSLQTGFQLQKKINGGTTWNINLREHVPPEWVGSAHIYTDGAVYAMVDRVKVGYNMWITNTGSSADFENVAQVNLNTNTNLESGSYVLFAPHVLVDYFGWNTGINVANLANEHNNISIQYFNLFGNATQGATQRLAPHGMTYFYDPSIGPQNENEQELENDPSDENGSEDAADTTGDIVGSALIWSEYPVAAVVDATKYPENDPSGRSDVRQATSYSATSNIYTWQAVPFVSKGDSSDGSGATSGINIMNPNPGAATANVYYVNENGFRADNFGVSSVTIPGYANGFVYTLWQHNLPDGFSGAAQVISNLPVAAVSANVDYTVTGDGSAIFNAFNPCGFYRTNQGDTAAAFDIGRLMPDCSFGNALDVSGGSVTKTFVDPDGTPIPNIRMSIINQNPAFPYQQDGETGPDGTKVFTNVPVGDYELIVDPTSVPDDYMLPAVPADVFTVEYGSDLQLVNTLEWAQGVTKYVCAATEDGEFDGMPFDSVDEENAYCAENNLAGVNVIIYEVIGTETGGSPTVIPLYDTVTGINGFTAYLPVGDYLLCIYDADGIATTRNEETVGVALPEEPGTVAECQADGRADTFDVEIGETTFLYNPVVITEGVLNILLFVPGLGVGAQDPVGGVQLCLDPTIPSTCRTSDSNGIVSFERQQLATSGLSVSLNTSGYQFVDAFESLSTDIEFPIAPFVVAFGYSPTLDLAQDGWSNDVLNGTPDMSIQLATTP